MIFHIALLFAWKAAAHDTCSIKGLSLMQHKKVVSKRHVSKDDGLLHATGDSAVAATLSSKAWADNLYKQHSSRSAQLERAHEKATQVLQAMKNNEKNLLAQKASNVTAHHENSSAHYGQKLLDANATHCRECGNAEEALVAATHAALMAHAEAQKAAAVLGLAAKNYATASQGFGAANKEYTRVVNQMCPITLIYDAAESAFDSIASAAQDLKQKALKAQQHKAWEMANKTVMDAAQSQYDVAAARAKAAEQPIAAKEATAAAACASIVTQEQFLLTGVVSAGHARAPVNVVTITETSVKYATNRGPYRLKNIPYNMFGSLFVQGDNDKSTGEQKFTTNKPVVVYVAIDSRSGTNSKAAPNGFTRYGSLTFEHGHNRGIVDFPMYKKTFPAGTHSFQFRKVCMAAWFVQDAPFSLTGVVSAGHAKAPVKVVTITESSVKYATNRGPYKLKNIPRNMFGSLYVQGDNDKSTGEQKFTTNRPVVVYVAIDSRSGTNSKALPDGFTRTESLTFEHGHNRGIVDFPLYKKTFPAGTHSFQFRKGCMAAWFVQQVRFLLSGVVSAGHAKAPVNVVTITESSVKYATNRGPYKLKNIPSKMLGSLFVQGDNDKDTGEQKFTTNRPVVVYVAIDSRSGTNSKALPEGFTSYGSLTFEHGRNRGIVDFPLYIKAFPAGTHSFQFRKVCMAAWFVQEAQN